MNANVRFSSAGAAAIAGIMLLAGCASAAPTAQNTEPVASVSSEEPLTATELVGDWGIISADADPVSEVDELVEFSELGVLGVVGGFTQARLETNDPLGSDIFEPVVMRLDSPEVVAGELPEGNDGHVYIALPGTTTAEEYAAAMPTGAMVVAYGNDLTRLSEVTPYTVLEGVPEGQGVFNVSHPAGLGIEVQQPMARSSEATPVLVFPLQGTVAEGVKASSIVPGEELPEVDDPFGN